MSILSNLILLLLSTSLVCAAASDDEGKDVAGNAGGPNMNIFGNLSDIEVLRSIKQWVAVRYQRGKNETTSSPIPLSQKKAVQKSENETISKTEPEPPSKSPLRARLESLRARLESLMANPNTSVETKSALKLVLTGNTAQSPFSTNPTLVYTPVPQGHTIIKAPGFHTEGGRAGIPPPEILKLSMVIIYLFNFNDR